MSQNLWLAVSPTYFKSFLKTSLKGGISFHLFFSIIYCFNPLPHIIKPSEQLFILNTDHTGGCDIGVKLVDISACVCLALILLSVNLRHWSLILHDLYSTVQCAFVLVSVETLLDNIHTR